MDILNIKDIENKIYEFRGKQVMLDSDLAELYECKNGTKKVKVETRGGKYKNPFVFTEQGVTMLSSVIRTEIAAQVNISIMRVFISMRHYIKENKDIYVAISNLNNIIFFDTIKKVRIYE